MHYNNRMRLSVRFKIRRSKSSHSSAVVYCRISVNGIAATDFSTGIRADAERWNSKLQRIAGNGREVAADNDTLTSIRADLVELFNSARRTGKPFGAADLRSAYLQKSDSVPTFLQCFGRVVAARSGKRRTTPRAFEQVRDKVAVFLSTKNRRDVVLSELTDELLIELQDYWCSTLKNSTVNQYQSYVCAALDWAFHEGYTRKNFGAKLGRLAVIDKELLYLEESEVAAIRKFRYGSKTLCDVAACFLAQCYTGLAYSDLRAFRPATHVRTSPRGTGLIQYQRTKNSRLFTIPVLEPMQRLLEKYPAGFPVPPLPEYNNLIRIVGEMAGCAEPEKLTSHVGRKTAGVFLLNNDVPIETVSAILGHSKVATTQRHYARVLTGKIERDTAHLMPRPVKAKIEEAV